MGILVKTTNAHFILFYFVYVDAYINIGCPPTWTASSHQFTSHTSSGFRLSLYRTARQRIFLPLGCVTLRALPGNQRWLSLPYKFAELLIWTCSFGLALPCHLPFTCRLITFYLCQIVVGVLSKLDAIYVM